MKRGFAHLLGYIFASVVISFVFLSLMRFGRIDRYGYASLADWLGYFPSFSIAGIFLFFFMGLGFRMREGVFLSDKIGSVLFIMLPLFAPFVMAIRERQSMETYLPFPWWIAPFVAALLMFLWSAFVAYLDSKLEKTKRKNAL